MDNNLYAVSLVFRKDNSTGFEILNNLRVLHAASEDEAIGTCTREAFEDKYKGSNLMFHVCVKINIS